MRSSGKYSLSCETWADEDDGQRGAYVITRIEGGKVVAAVAVVRLVVGPSVRWPRLGCGRPG